MIIFIALAPFKIREQGLAPTWTLLLREFCGRLPLRPNDCSGSSQHSRAGARSYKDQHSRAGARAHNA